jgi:hypothetical protein
LNGADLKKRFVPGEEIVARRAVAGLDVKGIKKFGLTPVEADAMSVALRRYMVGDDNGALAVLTPVFNGSAKQILAEFRRVAEAA